MKIRYTLATSLFFLLAIVEPGTFITKAAGDTPQPDQAMLDKLHKGLFQQGKKLVLTSNFTNEGLSQLGDKSFAAVVTVYVQGPLNDTGISNFQRLTNLSELRVDFASITDRGLASLKGLPLQLLEFSNVPITAAGIAQLKPCPTLRHLELIRTGATNDMMALVRDFPGLKSLRLWEDRIDNMGLAQLKGSALETLWLRCPVTGAGLLELKELPNLKQVDFFAEGAAGMDRASLDEFHNIRPDVKLLVEGRPFDSPELASMPFNFKRMPFIDHSAKGEKSFDLPSASSRVPANPAAVPAANNERAFNVPSASPDLRANAAVAPLNGYVTTNGKILEIPAYFSRLHDSDMGQLSQPKYQSLERVVINEWNITDNAMGHVAALDNVRHIDLNGANISGLGLAKLKRLPLLQSITLGQSILDDSLKELRQFPQLKYLDLQSPHISEKGLASIRELKLEGLAMTLVAEQFSLASQLADLPLQALTLFKGTYDSGKLQQLRRLPLRELNLKYAAFEGKKPLAGLRGLKLPYLSLEGSAVTDADLADLKGLDIKALNLRRTAVSDQGIRYLKSLQLQILLIFNTRISSAAVSDLLSANPGLIMVGQDQPEERESLQVQLEDARRTKSIPLLFETFEQQPNSSGFIAGTALWDRFSPETCGEISGYLPRLVTIIADNVRKTAVWRKSWYDGIREHALSGRFRLAIRLLGCMAECKPDALNALRRLYSPSGDDELNQQILVELCRFADKSFPGLLEDYLAHYSGKDVIDGNLWNCANGNNEDARSSALSSTRSKLLSGPHIVSNFEPAEKQKLHRMLADYLVRQMSLPKVELMVFRRMKSFPPEELEGMLPQIKRFILEDYGNDVAVRSAIETVAAAAKNSELARSIIKEAAAVSELSTPKQIALADALVIFRDKESITLLRRFLDNPGGLGQNNNERVADHAVRTLTKVCSDGPPLAPGGDSGSWWRYLGSPIEQRDGQIRTWKALIDAGGCQIRLEAGAGAPIQK